MNAKLKTQSIITLILLLSISNSTSSQSQRSLLRDSPQGTKNSNKHINESESIQSCCCSEVIVKSTCNSNTNCRWCRSHVVGDMCTSKIEAWRLPSQVFNCHY
ncbi:hypothetical protein vseg_008903 [Gypsophila vaccaria]